jgi:glucose-6-phosphate isomerase
MGIHIDTSKTGLSQESLEKKRSQAEEAMDRLWSGEEPFTGWVQLPLEHNQESIENLLNVAAEVWSKCDLFVVLGIGGSSLGAKAVLDALTPMPHGFPRVVFAGFNLDAASLLDISEQVRREETCICTISKSGATVETLIAFSVLKEVMHEKYGPAANSRIYAITDEKDGALRKETNEKGYVSFPVPTDIGGRYSVLTPVGLFPLAVAGVDIKALLAGAEAMAVDPAWDREAILYAISRVCLHEEGKTIEALESFDPSMETFGQWLKQLFGESEGKEGKGIYPTVLSFTRDLHSVGQYLQEGTPNVFETMILFETVERDLLIPESAGADLSGLAMSQINNCLTKGVIAAHAKAGIPLITITTPLKDAFHLGRLIYFFELSCGVSATMFGVNPFNQPGVERYKQESIEEIRKLRVGK